MVLPQNINDSMTVLPKLSTGLDVNVRFTGVSDFEYTPECIVFDLLNVPLYHGWLLDPQVGRPHAPRGLLGTGTRGRARGLQGRGAGGPERLGGPCPWKWSRSRWRGL